MILELKISNYALIDDLRISFDSRMNVITGETGAGKSILLGALGLCLGQRADTSVLKDKDKKCIVEASFALDAIRFKSFFEEADLDFYSETILRREILPSARTRAFINDTPVGLGTLQNLSSKLVDVSSQNDNVLLKDQSFLIEMLDSLAGQEKDFNDYQITLNELKRLEKAFRQKEEEKARLLREKDFIEFQHKEMQSLGLEDTVPDQDDLESELHQLENVDGLKASLLEAAHLLRDGDQNALEILQSAHKTLSSFAANKNVEELSQKLDSLNIEIRELSHDIDRLQATIEANPERLAEVERKLSEIYRLERKHNVQDIHGLQQIFKELSAQLHVLENSEEESNSIKEALRMAEKEAHGLAEKLSKSRSRSASSLQKSLLKTLASLGMSGTRIELEVDKGEKILKTRGYDELKFRFAANPGSELKELHKAASGGELSRIMLSLKSGIAGSFSLPTLIFDEIDSGISGDIAGKTARLLSDLAENHQLICITHLPQIAAVGHRHFFVSKELEKETAHTEIRELAGDERVGAIARMMSAEESSNAALEHAKHLLSGRD